MVFCFYYVAWKKYPGNTELEFYCCCHYSTVTDAAASAAASDDDDDDDDDDDASSIRSQLTRDVEPMLV